MNPPSDALTPVQFYGGPWDGYEDQLPLKSTWEAVLMRQEFTGIVYAYEWADRSVDGGKRWVLQLSLVVGKQGGVQ